MLGAGRGGCLLIWRLSRLNKQQLDFVAARVCEISLGAENTGQSHFRDQIVIDSLLHLLRNVNANCVLGAVGDSWWGVGAGRGDPACTWASGPGPRSLALSRPQWLRAALLAPPALLRMSAGQKNNPGWRFKSVCTVFNKYPPQPLRARAADLLPPEGGRCLARAGQGEPGHGWGSFPSCISGKQLDTVPLPSLEPLVRCAPDKPLHPTQPPTNLAPSVLGYLEQLQA